MVLISSCSYDLVLLSMQDMVDQSQVYNGVDIHDQHSNMRLDVDNMSYEVYTYICCCVYLYQLVCVLIF